MKLHDAIMNLPVAACLKRLNFNHQVVYKIGHRDARHAAAELAVSEDAELDRLKAINAELLEACLSVIEYNEAKHTDSIKMMIDYADSLALCRAAVASATGEIKS